MRYFAGLDVSLEETAICVVDETGRIASSGQRAGPAGSDFAENGVCRWSASVWKLAL